MFPFDTDEDDGILTEDQDDELIGEDSNDYEDEPLEFGVDFATGRLTGGKVTGSKAVAVWAWNALMHPRYRYETATDNYGNELSDLIGQALPPDEASMLVESLIRDAFLPNENIIDIEDMACDMDSDHLTVSFKLITAFGVEEMTDVTIRG